jgi:hypothetical protein
MVGVFGNKYSPTQGPAASVTEWRSHFGAWVIVSSPLILSFDLANATTMRAVWPFITNLEAIAVSQTWAGHPGRRVATTPSFQIWTKKLGPRRSAALAINMESPQAKGAVPTQITITLADLSPPLTGAVSVRDVWGHADLGTVTNGTFVTSALAPHDSALLIFEEVAPHV